MQTRFYFGMGFGPWILLTIGGPWLLVLITVVFVQEPFAIVGVCEVAVIIAKIGSKMVDADIACILQARREKLNQSMGEINGH